MALGESNDVFGEALIAALEDAIAFERGDLPATRVDRVGIATDAVASENEK